MDKIIYGIHGTEFGDVILARSDKGLCWLGFMTSVEEGAYKGDGLTRLKKLFPVMNIVRDDAGTADLMKMIMTAWREDRLKDIPLDLHGTAFQKSVWQALLEIPAGQAWTYSDVAQKVGKPKAVRAVGTAVGENPVSLIVPCHRVVRSDGGLGNYGWGVDIKEKLLVSEGYIAKVAA